MDTCKKYEEMSDFHGEEVRRKGVEFEDLERFLDEYYAEYDNDQGFVLGDGCLTCSHAVYKRKKQWDGYEWTFALLLVGCGLQIPYKDY